nr:glycosyltransferase [Anaerolineae bacterium]
MRILICHNYYRDRSGEASVVKNEMRLLQEQGHVVDLFTADNAEVNPSGIINQARAGLNAISNGRTAAQIRQLLATKQYDVAHVHNTWLVMSPSVYRALWQAGIPVVKTVHNYRWLCPTANFYRDGRVCHDCTEKPCGLLHAVKNRCYHDSTGMSAIAAGRLLVNRDLLRTFHRFIDVIVVQNDFVKKQLISRGFPAEKMMVKGNFVHRPQVDTHQRLDHMVFFGRLAEEKGLDTLLDAAEMTGVRLHIFGQGPISERVAAQVEERFGHSGRVRFRGYAPYDELVETIATAQATIFPSEWYESFPITITESMAYGKPLIASNLGAMSVIIRDGYNGLHFEAGNAHSLAEKIRWFQSDPHLQEKLCAGARETYKTTMTPEVNYTRLMEIYDRAVRVRR